jgi:hypothetical protein
VKRKGGEEYYIGRRYGDFARMHKRLRTELPGKILPSLPKKNKQSTTASNLMSAITFSNDDDASSVSSVSTMNTTNTFNTLQSEGTGSTRNLVARGKWFDDHFDVLELIKSFSRSSPFCLSKLARTFVAPTFYRWPCFDR